MGWIGLALVAALMAAAVALLGKVGLREVEPTAATFLRSIIMAVALAFAVAFTPAARAAVAQGVGGRAWLFIALSGLAGAASWWAYFGALRFGPAGPVAALDRLSVAFVLLGAATLLGESVGWRGWLGLALVVGGSLLIVADATA